MRILVIGGSGLVGGMVVPDLARDHQVRVFDLREPPPGPQSHPAVGASVGEAATTEHAVEYIVGDVTQPGALAAAMTDVDAMIFLAMGPLDEWGTPASAAAHLDVSPKGLYLALQAAAAAGVRRAVYASSMSVYSLPELARRDTTGGYPVESWPTDATDFYGLAKRFGEEVCRAAAVEWRLSVIALRLCFPVQDADWPPTNRPWTLPIATSGRDVARAFRAAITVPNEAVRTGGVSGRRQGFVAIAISGDTTGRVVPTTKARELLGWEPLDPAGLGTG